MGPDLRSNQIYSQTSNIWINEYILTNVANDQVTDDSIGEDILFQVEKVKSKLVRRLGEKAPKMNLIGSMNVVAKAGT